MVIKHEDRQINFKKVFDNSVDKILLNLNRSRNNWQSVSMTRHFSIVFVMSIMAMMIESSAIGDGLSSLSSLTSGGILTDPSQTSSYSNAVYHESPEKMVESEKVDNVGHIENDVKSTTSNIVLQPNIAGALDVGQGLLVPLVPVVDPNSKNSQPLASPLVANLLPVAVETVTPIITTPVNVNTDAEVQRINDDMEVAEDIIFRPLFRYRQEAAARRKSYNRNEYYQPYIYAYKPSRQSDYNDDNDRRRLRYYPRDYDD